MDRLSAVPYLQNECCFERPLTAEEAEEMWLTHRNRVEALPARQLQPPQRFPITTENRQLVNQFLSQFRGPEVLDVIKINPMELAIYQMYVVTDRADHHANQTGDWAKKTLVLNRPIVQLPWRVEDGALKLSLPHGEHQIWINPNGTYGIQQGG